MTITPSNRVLISGTQVAGNTLATGQLPTLGADPQNSGREPQRTIQALASAPMPANVPQGLAAALGNRGRTVNVIPEYENAVFAAARLGDAEVVKFFLKRAQGGFNPQAKNSSGKTAADVADDSGHHHISALLRLAYPSSEGSDLRAQSRGNYDEVDSQAAHLLLDIRGPATAPFRWTHKAAGGSVSSLATAAITPQDQAIRVGKNPEPSPSVLLYTAIINGDSATFLAQVEVSEDINAELHEGDNALHLATWEGRPEMVQRIVERPGIDINRESMHLDYPGCTALHFAAMQNRAHIAGELLQLGIDVNKQNAAGSTALHIAAFSGFGDVVRTLLGSEDIDIGCVSKEYGPLGKTALQIAVMGDVPDVVSAILETKHCTSFDIEVALKQTKKCSKVRRLLEEALKAGTGEITRETMVTMPRSHSVEPKAKRPKT